MENKKIVATAVLEGNGTQDDNIGADGYLSITRNEELSSIWIDIGIGIDTTKPIRQYIFRVPKEKNGIYIESTGLGLLKVNVYNDIVIARVFR